MEALVMGIQKIDFVDKQNNPIEGKRLYLAFSEESVQGYRTESFFVRNNIQIPEDIQPTDKIKVEFSYKGKVQAISKIK